MRGMAKIVLAHAHSSEQLTGTANASAPSGTDFEDSLTLDCKGQSRNSSGKADSIALISVDELTVGRLLRRIYENGINCIYRLKGLP
jgi:hypothetical protein